MTGEQQRARAELAASVGPAIVWAFEPKPKQCVEPGALVFATDTYPGLDLLVTANGGISTPLYCGRSRMLEAMADDEKRVLRTVGDMMSVAAMRPRAPFETIGMVSAYG